MICARRICVENLGQANQRSWHRACSTIWSGLRKIPASSSCLLLLVTVLMCNRARVRALT